MAKIVLNIDGPEGTKIRRALDAFALLHGQTVEESLMPTLRGIAQQMGVDANDDETDQEAALTKAERNGSRAKRARDDRAAEAVRLQAEADQRRADEEAKAIAAATKTEPTEKEP